MANPQEVPANFSLFADEIGRECLTTPGGATATSGRHTSSHPGILRWIRWT